jgi:hypothetical protein
MVCSGSHLICTVAFYFLFVVFLSYPGSVTLQILYVSFLQSAVFAFALNLLHYAHRIVVEPLWKYTTSTIKKTKHNNPITPLNSYWFCVVHKHHVLINKCNIIVYLILLIELKNTMCFVCCNSNYYCKKLCGVNTCNLVFLILLFMPFYEKKQKDHLIVCLCQSTDLNSFFVYDYFTSQCCLF